MTAMITTPGWAAAAVSLLMVTALSGVLLVIDVVARSWVHLRQDEGGDPGDGPGGGRDPDRGGGPDGPSGSWKVRRFRSTLGPYCTARHQANQRLADESDLLTL